MLIMLTTANGLNKLLTACYIAFYKILWLG